MLVNQFWPDGILKRVSRTSYDAVNRARGFMAMTPEEREREATGMDRLFNRGSQDDVPPCGCECTQCTEGTHCSDLCIQYFDCEKW